MIVTFAGNRVDEPDRPDERFPAANVDAVGRRIGAYLGAEKPELVVGAAASGADLLVLSEARRLAIPIHVVLPLTIERFRRSGVQGQGEDWLKMFDQLVFTAEGLTVEDLSQHDDWYRRGNEVILSTAARLAAGRLVNGLVVATAGDASASDDFRRGLEHRNWPYSTIDPGAP